MLKKLLVIGLLGVGLLAGLLFWAHDHMMDQAARPLQVDAVQIVEVKPGDTVTDVLAGMASRGMLGEPRWLAWFAQLSELAHRLHVGEFEVRPGDSWAGFLQRLTSGKVLQRRWTIVPGWTVREMLASLRELPLAHTPGLAEDSLPLLLALPVEHAEGWFLPDTYAYVRGEQDLDLLRRAFDAMSVALEKAWQARDVGLPYKDQRELLIAASLVEKETGHPDDRAYVAAVFVRRLQKRMRLQTDPTVIYGLGAAFDGNLTRKHLRTPGPYNTYTNHGLPPTPIALPGPPALAAAASPAQADFLYFVARGDGTSQFSRTLEEHVAAVRRYQLNRR